MKRGLFISFGALALVLVFAAGASAAVSFSFTEAKHDQAAINRGDEFVSYSVKVKNTGSEGTTGISKVALTLPIGVKLSKGSGSGWSCDLDTQVCSNAAVLAAGSEFPQLKLQVWIYPDLAPDTVIAGFSAFGGGAGGEALISDSFTFGPQALFEMKDLSAGVEDLNGDDYTIAGGHPFTANSSFSVPLHIESAGKSAPVESLRDLHFELPAGFIGNPHAAAHPCTFVQVSSLNCPESEAVGGVNVGIDPGFPAAIYRIDAEAGYPAAFAFRAIEKSSLTYVLRPKLRSNGDYGITVVAPLPPQAPEFKKLEQATLCSFGAKTLTVGSFKKFMGCKEAGSSGSLEIPFMTNPTRCAGPAPLTRAHMDSFQHPGAVDAEGFPNLADPSWKSAEVASPSGTDCEALSEAWVGKGPHPTQPSLAFQPDTTQAAAPAAYIAQLHIPQEGLVEQQGLAPAHLKDTIVTLPAGLALNPSAASGLGACSLDQVGYLGNDFPAPNPIHFSTTSAGCPQNSKIGTVEVRTPLLDKPLPGSVFLAAQDTNPFGSRFAIYLVVEGDEFGVHATLAGKVIPNGQSGQIVTTFSDNPQVPVEDLEVSFLGGPRASLANPDICGPYTTHTALTPWSAVDPDHPAASEIAGSDDTVVIDSGPNGGPCATSKAARPFGLGFSAGVTNPLAGAHSPFTVRITRPDGNQEFDKVSLTTPPGFAATLAGVATCSAAAITAAQAPGRTGAQELATPSCPAASQIGSTTIGAGVGPNPYYVKTGKVYLTGPYKGAPLSLAFIVPAVAGPFDLGVQVVRTALRVNPKTAQITAESDPIPQILDGVPLQVRDIRVDIDRKDFSLNPTSCAEMAVSARVNGASGAVANLSNRFQVGKCAALKFKPKLKIQLHGGTKRNDYQRLTATVTAKPGEANIARAAVTFPHSAFLAQEHIVTICTRVQFAAHTCPKGSVYGHATAITPLLSEPLSGPVYLRSSDNPLPDLVAALRGPDSMPIEVELSGRTDSKNGGIRNTFDLVPDAPVSKFTLQLLGGRKSLIVNSRDLCKKGKQRATVRMGAQNGKVRNFRTVVANDCGKGGKKKKDHKRHRRHAMTRLLGGW